MIALNRYNKFKLKSNGLSATKQSCKLESSSLLTTKQSQGKIFVISGPSGSGKTTLLSSLIQDKKIGKILKKSCSITTRPKRSQEREGKEYFFVSAAEFKRLLKAKKILEWTRYLGYYYGTPKEALERQLKGAKNVGLCLDLKGARALKKMYPENTVTIFVLPPSLGTLKERIQNRCRHTNQQEIEQRLLLARKELQAAGAFDYCILNQKLSVALKELKNIFWQESSI
ncbi:MAG: guanylate kinase [Candidatus Omnitrophica bacterium]|nr:guanylate kinase [Candidatus Omnitrophota bacterium]